jgi:hypothetical protein
MWMDEAWTWNMSKPFISNRFHTTFLVLYVQWPAQLMNSGCDPINAMFRLVFGLRHVCLILVTLWWLLFYVYMWCVSSCMLVCLYLMTTAQCGVQDFILLVTLPVRPGLLWILRNMNKLNWIEHWKMYSHNFRDGGTVLAYLGSQCTNISHSWVYMPTFYVLSFSVVYLASSDFTMDLNKGAASVHQILCKYRKKCDGDPSYD